MRHLFIIALILLCLPLRGHQACAAGGPTKPGPCVGRYAGNRSDFRTKVFRMAAIGGALTMFLLPHDRRAQSAAVESPYLEVDAIDIGDLFGNGLTLAGLSAATWEAGHLTGHDGASETGRLLAEGLILDGMVTQTVKHVIGRQRPDRADHLSFPSGHTSGAFTFATILARRHGWSLGVPAYTLAAMTAAARMEDDRHYLSDVVAGGMLGVLIGELVTPTEDKPSRNVRLYASRSRVGLSLAF